MILTAILLFAGGSFLGKFKRKAADVVAGTLCLLYGLYLLWCSLTAFV